MHPGHLFHIGMVTADIDATMDRLSQQLGLHWKGGRRSLHELCLYGEEKTLEMRVAHSVEGLPHIELIEQLDDTLWVATNSTELHHLCYWSDKSFEDCCKLESQGYARVLGKAGSDMGYFKSPDGLLIEIINAELRGLLSTWLAK